MGSGPAWLPAPRPAAPRPLSIDWPALERYTPLRELLAALSGAVAAVRAAEGRALAAVAGRAAEPVLGGR